MVMYLQFWLKKDMSFYICKCVGLVRISSHKLNFQSHIAQRLQSVADPTGKF